MTTKCHAELSLIYFTIQILRYAQYDEKLLVILRAAPEESILNQQEREMNLQAGHDSLKRYFATLSMTNFFVTLNSFQGLCC